MTTEGMPPTFPGSPPTPPPPRPEGRYEPKLPPEQRQQYELGQRYAEMNTILGRIRHRRGGEPTARERQELADLREEIARLKRTGSAAPAGS